MINSNKSFIFTRDAGGAILVNGVQVAIPSWSTRPCTVPLLPVVATEISHYVDWIQEKIGSRLKSNMFLIGSDKI